MASERNNMCGIMRVEKRKIWDVTGIEMQNLKYTKAFIKANKTKFDEFIKSKEFEKELSDEFLEIW